MITAASSPRVTDCEAQAEHCTIPVSIGGDGPSTISKRLARAARCGIDHIDIGEHHPVAEVGGSRSINHFQTGLDARRVRIDF